MRVRAIKEHTAIYADPICVKAGDRITLTGKTDEWDGHIWLWAVGADGKAGWVPDTIVEKRGERLQVNRDYSAIELTCTKDEILNLVEKTHGWAWCRSSAGNEGWVPLRILLTLPEHPPISPAAGTKSQNSR